MAKRKSIRFLPFGTRGTIRVFSFRGPSARFSVFLVQNRCFYPARPFASLATFGLNVHFYPFFGTGDLQFCEARRLGLVRPQNPSWCPVTPSFGEPPTAGRQRVFSWVHVVKSPGKLGCGLPLREHRGPGPVRASVLLSWVLTEAGVTPAVHLRGPAPLPASPTQPVGEYGGYLQTSLCPGDVGSRHPCP